VICHIKPDTLFADNGQTSKGNIEINIKEISLVKNSKIVLGDISDINANGFLKEALEKIELGSSPKPGKIKSYDRKKIVFIIQGQRYLPENIVITSPQQIYVKRLSQTISKQKVRQFVAQQLSRLFENRECQLKTLNVRGLELYPQGNTRFRLDSNKIVNNSGKLSCYIDIIVDEIKEDRLVVSGIVAVYENVLYARNSLKRGETVSRENVYQEKKNIYELSDNFIKTFDEIDGKILKSGVRKGDYLKTNLLAEPPLIKKGDIITLVARNENLLIVTSAISKEDGFENELIKVENLNSGKLVRGIVKGKSKVEVIY